MRIQKERYRTVMIVLIILPAMFFPPVLLGELSFDGNNYQWMRVA